MQDAAVLTMPPRRPPEPVLKAPEPAAVPAPASPATPAPPLAKEGIVVIGLKDLTEEHRKHLRDVFRREIFPVLTPLAIDQGHPFPHLLNKSLNLAVLLKRPRNQDKLFAVVQVPAVLPRF